MIGRVLKSARSIPQTIHEELSQVQSPQTQITVVMLSWMRSANVLEILDALDRDDAVAEILVWNNNSGHRDRLIPSRRSKARVVDARENWGFYPKLAMSALASNPIVMILDDDLFVDHDTIEFLMERVQKLPDSLHGIRGRQRSSEGRYEAKNEFGKVEMLIGRCIMGRRELFARALEFSYLVEDVQKQSSPYGNGEDLILSYSTLYHFNQMNYAYDLPFREMKDHNAVSNQAGHFDHRTRLMNRCRELIAMKNKMRDPQSV